METALWVLIGLGWAATLAASAAPAWWVCELFSHFRAQYAVFLLLCALPAMAAPYPEAAAAASIGGMVNLAMLLPAYGRMTLAPEPQRRGAKALLMNVNHRNRHPQAALQLVRLMRPDLIAVIEVNRAWRRHLETLRRDYPHVEGVALRDGWGLMLFSRLPFQRSRTVRRRESGIPYVLAELAIKGQPLHVMVTHPYAPMSRRYARERNRQLGALARIVARLETPVLVLGDFNCSPWSPYFRRLLKASGLRDSRHGFGLQPTWPAWNRFFGIPIDHCLVSRGIRVLGRRIGPDIRSDHLPVCLEFSLGAARA